MNFFKNIFSGVANKAIAGTVGSAVTGYVLNVLNMLPGASTQMTVKDYVAVGVAFVINGLLVYATPNKPVKT